MQVIMSAAQAAAATPHGARGAIVQGAAQTLNLSVQRAHTLIAEAARQLGLKKPRKRRADAGKANVTDAELDLIAGVLLYDRRAGKDMLAVEAAIDLLRAEGKIATPLSTARITDLLRQRGLDRRGLAAPTPHVRMRTEHVNAVWQIDASVCVLYKAPQGGVQLVEEDGVHYKNKPENLVRIADQLITRFVGVEHASGAIAVRYYLGGESAKNALDFLMWMMTRRHGPAGDAMPLHGVPFLLYTDQGGWSKAGEFRNFCSAMDIRQQWHAVRNSRATGGAENGQNLVERGFESRLRFIDRASLSVPDGLNDLAELWMHSFNGMRQHGRHGLTRYAAWSTIGAEHLRVAPSMAIMRELPVSLAQPRQVRGDMTVSFARKGQGSRDYDVRYVPGVSPRDKVLVAVNPLAAPAVRVGVTDRETGEIVWHQIEPVQEGWLGYRADAPVLGQNYKAQPATPADERRARIAAQAFATAQGPATSTQAKAAQKAKATPYLGQFDPFADIKAQAATLPTFLQRRGTPHAVAAPTVEAARVPVAEACKQIRLALKDAYDTGTYAFLTKRYGQDGVPQDAVQGLIAAARQQAAGATPVPGGLRAVGGTK